MKKYLYLALLSIFAISCSNNQQTSDGYGNFETEDAAIISAQTAGNLLQFNVQEGTVLQKNQVIGLIDTTDLNLKKDVLINQKKAVASQLTDIEATIAVQKQQLKINQINMDRTKKLYEAKAATQKQWDDISGLVALNKKQIVATQSKRIQIKAQMQTINAQIAEINNQIQKCVIKNPVGGTVLVKYAETGELAAPGKPLYQIANLNWMELKAFISGSQLRLIKPGQKVKVYYDKNKTQNIETDGTVLWISPTAEFTPKTIQTKEERVNLVYAVKIKVNNENGALKIGMPGSFRFINNH
ncbi:MAG: HlyD family efflux transporter periplasmic adaptor subunit [Bacteroidales bacterium]|nr:HlyD family efflux transporter periplasmic adaptor subunit [Bacteroidales bacterium]